jgi:hypothetical protein
VVTCLLQMVGSQVAGVALVPTPTRDSAIRHHFQPTSYCALMEEGRDGGRLLGWWGEGQIGGREHTSWRYNHRQRTNQHGQRTDQR